MILRSFDVFDTVITRSHACPEDVHWELARRLHDRGLVPDTRSMCIARRDAEREAWVRRKYRGSISIDDVYDILARRLDWSDRTRELALGMEVDLERSSSRAVLPVVRLIEECRRQGDAICFVSDMHLRADHIRRILGDLGIWRAGDPIFVSSDRNKTKKARGELFAELARETGFRPRQILHIGDQQRADVWMPRMRGIRTQHFRGAVLTAAERSVLESLPQDDPAARRVVAASKFSRLRAMRDHRRDPGRARILRDTIAPFIVSFSLWLLRQAQHDGVRQLLFLARDMRIVCEITKLLAVGLDVEMDCRYVHASRAAWQPAVLEADAELFWLVDQLDRPTVACALSRILRADEMGSLLTQGVPLSDEPVADVATALRALLAFPSCRAAVDAAVARHRSLLLGYLRQLGNTDAGGYAIVDAGWRGSLQRTLSKALALDGRPDTVRGYYVGLRDAPSTDESCPMRQFLESSPVERFGYSLVCLTEAFLIADHGTTLGYERVPSGAVDAVIASAPSAAMLAQFRAVQDACSDYLEEFLATVPRAAICDSLVSAMKRPFETLCANPTGRDARALRGWQFDAGRETSRPVTIAKPPGLADTAKLILAAVRNTNEGDIYLSGPWLRGSLALANPFARPFLRACVRKSVRR